MKITETPTPVHLSYCTNIHPGESWAEVLHNLRTHTLAVKRRVCPHNPFGIGLRLSREAAETLARPEVLADFVRFLGENELYVFTINGFPYGPFHGQPVKEQVYRPDWLEPERLDYTNRLAHILAALLPRDPGAHGGAAVAGSISTVPGCFRDRAAGAQALTVMADHLIQHAATLAGIAENGGPIIGLALEPEPHCAFETTQELLAFFDGHLFSDRAVGHFGELLGTNRGHAATLLQRHLGLCLDACHAAVEFETPDDIVTGLDRRGVRMLKMQVTTGLRVPAATTEALAVLDRFAEGVYLHQTVIRRGDTLVRHLDLPQALAEARAITPRDPTEEWRVHFHVPIFQRDLGGLHPGFCNTHAFLSELLRLQALRPLTTHLEVETYTWDVLPAELRGLPVDEAIALEIESARMALLQ